MTNVASRDPAMSEGYLAPEARARVEGDRQLVACGWVVQDRKDLSLYTSHRVTVWEFIWRAGKAGPITCCSRIARQTVPWRRSHRARRSRDGVVVGRIRRRAAKRSGATGGAPAVPVRVSR